jgi:hypothetical protein
MLEDARANHTRYVARLRSTPGRYMVRGIHSPMALPLTVAACVNDHAILAANLMTSPELTGPDAPQLIFSEDALSAAEGLNRAIRGASNDLVVCVHQDVVFPDGALAKLVDDWRAAATNGQRPLAVAGVAGVDLAGNLTMDVVGTDILRHGQLPTEASTLDEIVLMVDKRLWEDGTLAFEPALGWHLYGSDICLKARAAGFRAEIFNVQVAHNTKTTAATGFPPSFYTSERVLARLWSEMLPIRATCALVTAHPTEVAVVVPVVGRPHNAEPFMASLRATEPERAMAYALCEHDDPASQQAWRAAGAIVIADDEARSYAEKANVALGRTEEPWLLLVGDDVKFHPGWLDNALAKRPAKVIGTNDLQIAHAGRAPHALIARDYIMEVGSGWDGPGVVSFPYAHWYVDDEIATAAQQREVWAYAPESVIEHLHHSNRKSQDDDVYVRGRTIGAAQRPIFLERATTNLAYIPLLELGGGLRPHPESNVVLDTMYPKNSPPQDIAEVPWHSNGGKIVDCTVKQIFAAHVMEHIPRGDPLMAVMNEAWRVLEPGGVFTMIMPLIGYTRGNGEGKLVESWQPYADPTHVNFWWLPDALSRYFCGEGHLAAIYGAQQWAPLGRYVVEEEIDHALTNVPSFWGLRKGWEGTARIMKPASAPLSRSWL